MARVFQGLGAAMITPQTMAIITRIFPADRRGQAMALWGATAGVATLVGPILGGVLVDALGWEWIFFINIPVGMVGFVLAWRLVPTLPTHTHSFDWLGVALSRRRHVPAGVRHPGGPPVRLGHDRRTDLGAGADHRRPAGVRRVHRLAGAQPQASRWCPLALFRDRNFSSRQPRHLGDGFTITAMAFPIMLYAQLVRGLSPTRRALLLVPMALMSIVLAPWVGKLTDAVHPRLITAFGFAAASTSLVWLQPGDDPRLGDLGDPAADGAARRRQRLRLGAHLARPRPATCRCSWRAPAPASTTPRARSAPCSARPRSPC